MKKILTLIIFGLTIQFSSGQSCALYNIKYIGSIKSKIIKFDKIKLPTVNFLQGKKESKYAETNIKNNQFELVLGSPYGYTFTDSNELLEFYKSRNDKILVILIELKKGNRKEYRVELEWDNITIEKSNNPGFPRLFEIKLNEINYVQQKL